MSEGMQPIEVPERLRFDALETLPYSKYRLHRRVIKVDRSTRQLIQSETRRISISGPSNWYLLGNRSKVSWTSVLSGGSDATANEFADSRRRMKYGPFSAFSRVAETVNSGSLVVSKVDEACQTVGRIRAFASRRAGVVVNRSVVTSAGASQVADFSVKPSDININSLESAGCCSKGLRANVSADAVAPNTLSGFSYSVPLTAFSRLAQNEYVPVGLMSQFNPASAWQLEFTVAEAGDAQAAPIGAGSSPATGHSVYDLQLEAYFVEILDSRVQEAIVQQFNREVVQTEAGPMQLKLEIPILNVSHQVFTLRAGSVDAHLAIQSNSPSLRAVALVPRGQADPDGTEDYTLRWNRIQALAGGYNVMASPAEEDNALRPYVLDGWLHSQREDASSLFSLYAPHREAVEGASASSLIGLRGQGNNNCHSIMSNFENADGELPDQLRASRGLDMRNIGNLEFQLSYSQGGATNATVPLSVDVVVDVLLVEDVLYQVGRDGVRDVSNYEMSG